MLEIISDFFEEHQNVFQRIEDHISNKDLKSAELVIHKLASTLSSFHCGSLVAAVRNMERQAAEKDIEGLISAYPKLKENVGIFLTELDDIRKNLSNIV